MPSPTIKDFVNALAQQSQKLQGEIAQKLLNNQCGSFEEYRSLTGQVKGISQMNDVAYQLMKSIDMADEGDGAIDPLGDMPTDPPDDPPSSGKGPTRPGGNKRSRGKQT